MKNFKFFFLEVYWIGLFALLSIFSVKFIWWFHSFNTILFYIISFWLLYYDFKTFIQNISLTKSSYNLYKSLNTNNSNLKLYWFIFRFVVVFIFILLYLFKHIVLLSIRSDLYEGFKIIGLVAFIGFIMVNYYRLSIMYLKDL